MSAVRKMSMPEMEVRAGKDDQKTLRVVAHPSFIEIIDGNNCIRIRRSHQYYLQDIVDNFDFYFDGVDSLPFEGKNLVDYSTPRLHWVKGFELFPVMCASFIEPVMTTQQYLDIAKLPQGGVVLDLGAYCGLTGIMFALEVGKSGRVICVEADVENQYTTRTNLAYFSKIPFDAAPVALEEKAIWNHCNGIEFSSDGNMGATVSQIERRGDVRLVPSITLSEIARKYELTRLDFIKCDVEGAETVLFHSEQDLLQKFRPRLLIEPHYVCGRLSSDAFGPVLQKIGYQLEAIAQQGFPLPLIVATPL